MKKIVFKDLLVMGISILLVVVLINLFVYQYLVGESFKQRSNLVFEQIATLVEGQQAENALLIDDFNEICLNRTRTAAYIIENKPEVINDRAELVEIATLLKADEIHIFNKDGLLYAGSEPVYYGLSFNSGRQMQFFLPLLDHQDLELCQKVTANTSKSEPMKYAALWIDEENGIVQLGFKPGRLEGLEERLSIKEIIQDLVVSEEVEVLALDKESGEIIEASDEIFVGVNFYDLVDKLETGVDSLVFKDKAYRYISEDIGDYYLVRTLEESQYIHMILFGVITTSSYIMVVLAIIALWIYGFMNVSIIRNLNLINDKLDLIVAGDRDIELGHNKIKEFDKLNSNINKVVNSLISYVRKISVVFDLTKTKIGIIDYPDNATKITITGNVKDILGINKSDFDYLIQNPPMFMDILAHIKNKEAAVDENIYRVVNFDGEYRYIEIEEIRFEASTIAILRDVTDERNEILHLENERDTDVLTNVLNRRAFVNELSKLFKDTSKLAFGYIAIADIDGLKTINDTYGHVKGDEMIVKVAKSMKAEYDGRKAILARVGGDEFAIFEYGFNTLDDVKERIEQINRIKDVQTMEIDGEMHNIHFSIGYAYFPIESSDYQILLHIADNSMYDDKRKYKNKD